jgi:hypothetical protein
MDRIEHGLRESVRRRLLETGGAGEYADPAVFDRVWSLLARAAGGRNLDALLLPELLDGNGEWELKSQLSPASHRPVLGPFILLVKRRVLVPLSRWLLDYTRENFRRQQRVNRILFACIEELAMENARLRRELTEGTEQNVVHRETGQRRKTE